MKVRLKKREKPQPLRYFTVKFDDAFIKRYGPTQVQFPLEGLPVVEVDGQPTQLMLSDISVAIPKPIKGTRQWEEVRLIADIDGEPMPTYTAHIERDNIRFQFDTPCAEASLIFSAIPKRGNESV